MDKAVRFEQSGAVGKITLCRPDNRNSMTAELLDAFNEALDRAQEAARQAQAPIRVLVITGSGTCFSAGADLNAEIQRGDEGLLDHERSYQMYKPFLRVLDVKVPVIAALNGHAVGGGFGLALVCDIRIAHSQSKYGANFAKLGLHPGMAISYLLPRLIGLSRASELLYTGRLIRGTEALAMGLTSQAHDSASEVVKAADDMAKAIADNAPAAIRLTKESIQSSLQWDPRRAAYREAYAQAATLRTDDADEGVRALLEKRKPSFTGK